MLPHHDLAFHHWARVSQHLFSSPVTLTCVFGKQSVRPMTCDPGTSIRTHHVTSHTLSRVTHHVTRTVTSPGSVLYRRYDVTLPSSLWWFHSSPPCSCTHPPALVLERSLTYVPSCKRCTPSIDHTPTHHRLSRSPSPVLPSRLTHRFPVVSNVTPRSSSRHDLMRPPNSITAVLSVHHRSHVS